MTDVLVPVEVERNFNTFRDLRDSNITLYLIHDPRSSTYTDLYNVFPNMILASKVEYRQYNGGSEIELVSQMLHSKTCRFH